MKRIPLLAVCLVMGRIALAVEMPPCGLADAAARWDSKQGCWKPNADEAKAGGYVLEDPCTFADGTKLASAADWPRRRREILDIFAHEMYGVEPPAPEALVCDLDSEKTTAAGFAIRRVFRMYFRVDRTGPCVTWALWLPRHAKGRVPVVLALTYRGIHELVTDPDLPITQGWTRNRPQYGVIDHRATEATRGLMTRTDSDTVFPLSTLLARGYATMVASYTDVSPDPDPDGQDGVDQYAFATTNGVFTLWGKRDESRTDNVTSLGAWAWALSRGLDLALRQPEIDPKRTVVTGCSRLGKAALIAAARDERFAVCVPNQCGGGGVCLAKRDFGENVSTEVTQFTHWYCKAYAKYAPDPAKLLAFDQHLLVAAVAPRRVLVEGFSPSVWMDTKGEYLACRAASRAWEFLGLPGLPKGDWPETYDTSAIGPYLGYVRRTEQHGISGCDWNWLMDFADAAFADQPSTRTVACGGSYPFHLQGVATDGKSVFWSFTTCLVKTDLSGMVLAKAEKATETAHLGDPCCHGGKVYVGVNNGEANGARPGDEVWVYDAETLKLEKRYPTPQTIFCNNGLEWHDGHFYVVGSAPYHHDFNYVWQYTEDFRFERCLPIRSGWTHVGVQTICHLKSIGKIAFGHYGTEGHPDGSHRDYVFFVRPEDLTRPPVSKIPDSENAPAIDICGSDDWSVACGMLELDGEIYKAVTARTSDGRWTGRLLPLAAKESIDTDDSFLTHK